MVCTHRPRDVNLKFESLQLLHASSSSSFSLRSRNLPKGDSKLPLEPFIAPLTFTAVVRMCVAKAKAVEGAIQEELNHGQRGGYDPYKRL